jgi:hypothetical protein
MTSSISSPLKTPSKSQSKAFPPRSPEVTDEKIIKISIILLILTLRGRSRLRSKSPPRKHPSLLEENFSRPLGSSSLPLRLFCHRDFRAAFKSFALGINVFSWVEIHLFKFLRLFVSGSQEALILQVLELPWAGSTNPRA